MDKDKLITYLFSVARKKFKNGFSVRIEYKIPDYSIHILMLKIKGDMEHCAHETFIIDEVLSLKCDYQIKKRIEHIFEKIENMIIFI